MAKFNFIWEQAPVKQAAVEQDRPTVILGPGSIRLNAAAVNKLGEAEQVVLAYDPENRAIAVRPFTGQEGLKPYTFSGKIREDKRGDISVTLRCKPFMEKVRSALNLDLDEGRLCCPADWSGRGKMLIIQAAPDTGEQVEI